ncbi:MAG: hypothetical protein IMZ62_08190 [Chloroflexi bacterium]|nr:hypothetical protein [Chloroflexota bacterium]
MDRTRLDDLHAKVIDLTAIVRDEQRRNKELETSLQSHNSLAHSALTRADIAISDLQTVDERIEESEKQRVKAAEATAKTLGEHAQILGSLTTNYIDERKIFDEVHDRMSRMIEEQAGTIKLLSDDSDHSNQRIHDLEARISKLEADLAQASCTARDSREESDRLYRYMKKLESALMLHEHNKDKSAVLPETPIFIDA